jgi:hypothetical protein
MGSNQTIFADFDSTVAGEAGIRPNISAIANLCLTTLMNFDINAAIEAYLLS